MYSIQMVFCRARHLTLCAFILVYAVFGTGCAGSNVPKYNKNVIKNQHVTQAPVVWQYPPRSVMQEADKSESLSGLVLPKSVPEFMRDVEPPFIVAMQVLSDGSFVCVSPLELKYEPKRFLLGKWWRQLITEVKIILLREDGNVKWSKVISASGLYDITEINSTLLFQARRYDTSSKFLETRLVALKKVNGDILWQRTFTNPFRHFSIAPRHNLIVFATNSDKDTRKDRTIEAVDVSTGKLKWSFHVTAQTKDEDAKTAWPINLGDGIVLFEKGVTYRRLSDGRELWKRSDLSGEGIAQPRAFGDRIYMQSKGGLIALDKRSGRTKWTCAGVEDQLTKIVFTGRHLCITESEKTLFFKTHILSLIDLSSGRILWQKKTKPILGNIVESKDAIFFSTANHLVALDVKDGSVLVKEDLPWDDEFSYHVVSLRDDSVVVRNEWNVAMWKQKKGKLVYHHRFEPLCPIMTTEERMLEQKAFGAKASSTTTGALMSTNNVRVAWHEASFNSNMRMYRSTGNSSFLSSAQMDINATRTEIQVDRMMGQVEFGTALMGSIFAMKPIGMKAIHSMAFADVDQVIERFRSFDTNDYVVRLVGVQIGKQRFSAIEILHEPTGKVKRMLLSPYQMPSNLKTMGSHYGTANDLNGYLRAATYFQHDFSTVVDLERKRVFHYGPGLNVDEYVYFGKGGFIRGCLQMFQLEN